jgi:hypothetical protein
MLISFSVDVWILKMIKENWVFFNFTLNIGRYIFFVDEEIFPIFPNFAHFPKSQRMVSYIRWNMLKKLTFMEFNGGNISC